MSKAFLKPLLSPSLCFQNLDSLEASIQNLLSVLYPPFEATAPTLLSQLFQIIDSRYQGDALRCLLDFLVPAKHILDTVQQAACVSRYSGVLILCVTLTRHTFTTFVNMEQSCKDLLA